MAIDVSAQLLINRPKDEVAEYATNPDNDALWVSGIVEAKLLTEPPMAQGAWVESLASFLGKRM